MTSQPDPTHAPEPRPTDDERGQTYRKIPARWTMPDSEVVVPGALLNQIVNSYLSANDERALALEVAVRTCPHLVPTVLPRPTDDAAMLVDTLCFAVVDWVVNVQRSEPDSAVALQALHDTFSAALAAAGFVVRRAGEVAISDEDLRALIRVCEQSHHQWRDKVLRTLRSNLTRAEGGN